MSEDEAQRRFFEEHGWLVVRGAVAAARMAELVAAFDAVVPRAWLVGSAGKVVELPSASRASAQLAALVRDQALARLVANALGAARLQLLQDTIFAKAAEVGGAVEWHQDFTYLGYLDPPRAATLRIALTSETAASGCLRVLDGSHRWGHEAPLDALGAASVEDALQALPRALREQAAASEVLLELEPGDVTLHHCLTFHGSGPNRSGADRKTIAVRAFDAACRALSARIPPHAAAHFPTDARGGLSEEAFPVIYARAPEHRPPQPRARSEGP